MQVKSIAECSKRVFCNTFDLHYFKLPFVFKIFVLSIIEWPIGAVSSGSTLFARILNSSVMLGNYLQQTTSAVVLGQLNMEIQNFTDISKTAALTVIVKFMKRHRATWRLRYLIYLGSQNDITSRTIRWIEPKLGGWYQGNMENQNC